MIRRMRRRATSPGSNTNKPHVGCTLALAAVLILAACGDKKNKEGKDGGSTSSATGSAAAAASGSASASSSVSSSASISASISASSSAHHSPSWAYGGKKGPSFWGELAPKWVACKVGARQSPIDIPSKVDDSSKLAPKQPATKTPAKGAKAKTPARKAGKAAAKAGKAAAKDGKAKDGKANGKPDAVAKPLVTISASASKLSIDYLPIPLVIKNNGNTIQVDNTANNYITIGKTRYELLQLHLHSPSEHTLAGKRFDLELHLVHQSAAKRLAVVALLFDKGEANTALKNLWRKAPSEVSDKAVAFKKKNIDLSAMLSLREGYYHYQGSLTKPPCSEGVGWYVLKKTYTVAGKNVQRLRKLLGGRNNRMIQPLGGRQVVLFKP